jgi:hypothetical protein
MSTGGLGRRVPSDFRHVDKYPLLAAIVDEAAQKPRPMAIGVNWYHAFDSPEKDSQGHYWVARSGSNLGPIRGGHCVCLKARGVSDPVAWWEYYDQGAEGSCVGYGSSRMMSLLNRKRYDARWLYHEAQLVDEYAETPPEEGTSVRAGMDILRTRGHRVVRGLVDAPEDLAEGISANRWATSVDDALRVLGYQDVGYVDILNSWGKSWPHMVRMPATVLARLLSEDGEFAVVTDR